MAQVYRNAAITLAATKAHSSTDGLYTKSPTYCVTGNSMSSGEPYALFFRQKIDHHSENTTVLSGNNSIPGFVSHSTSEYHRLLTRAWVFQERLLSTRMLHFGPYELFFECCTDMQCECGGVLFLGSSEDIPLVMTKLLYTDAMENHDKRKKMRVVPSMAEGGTRSAGHWMARLWRTMVSSYMGLDITKPRDRLPAIGGLAQVLATKRTGTGADPGHSNYLAGLWLDTLSDDLLWIVYGGASLQPRPRTCDDLQCLSAPTWSWASVCDNTQYYDEIMSWHPDIWWFDGIVSERGRQPRHLAQIEACTVALDGDDKGDDDKTGYHQDWWKRKTWIAL
ncbi:tol protein [Grosmannia clavigera kw1407]|uniref:Tol protein n=1 Tax=Grosmannia clavigera (strain kw1407 / UAMH 11150) TaxID=655863 RepID=F0X9W3_GROCL|nr:tol protein [Grosmannia clavigera kw1407]EFX05265.1 tol protein [Grosmannia clavigera kw1407]